MSGFLQKPGGSGEGAVESVNGKIGNVVLTTTDINEGDNLYFTEERATDAVVDNLRGEVNGVASLDATGKIPNNQLPSIAITDVYVVADETARLALSATVGDVAIQTDNSTSYILADSGASDPDNWEVLGTGTVVNSVNGQTGTVLLDTDSIPEGALNKYFSGVTTGASISGDGDSTPLNVNFVNNTRYATVVKAATTAALAGTPTYNNGASGVGATLTRTGNAAFPNLDGIVINEGDIILVKNQATANRYQNGLYVLTSKGSASAPYVLTRLAGADTPETLNGLTVYVQRGSIAAGSTFYQAQTVVTVGTDIISFTDSSGTKMSQVSTGTQAANQIPVYTGAIRTLTRGTSKFKYDPTTDVITINGIDMKYPSTITAGYFKIDNTGNITFESGSSGVPEAPIDGKTYGRNDETWVEVATITYGTPTQSGVATGSVTVASNDYDEVNETEVTLGTLGTGGITYKYYDSRTDSAPSSPTVGIDISNLYQNGKIDSSVENVNIIEYSDKSDDFDTNYTSTEGYKDTTNVLKYYGQNKENSSVIVQADIADIGAFTTPIIKSNDNYGLFYGSNSNGINIISNLYKLTLTSTTGTYDDTAYSVDENLGAWYGIPSGLDGSDLYVYNTSNTPTIGETIDVYDINNSLIFSGEITAVSEITGNLWRMSRRVSPVSDSSTGIIATEDFYSSLVLENDYPIYQNTTSSYCNYDEIDTDTAVISKFGTNTFDFASSDLVIRLYNNSSQFNPQGMLIDSLTSSGFIQDGGTVTLGSKTYTFQNTLTNVDGNVKIGATDNDTLQNLTDAINLTGTAGTQYATAMTIHPTLSASRTNGTIVLTAKVLDTGGNGISCTTTVNGIVFRATGTNNIATVTAGGAAPSTTTLASRLNNAIVENIKPNLNGLRISNSASGANVNISCTVPGTIGNSFALATTNPTGISVSGATLSGGNTSGTAGSPGDIRLGYITGQGTEQTFLCVGTNVWKNLTNTSSPYNWTAA